MLSIELVIAAFLAIALLASIVSRRTATPYTLVLVLAGVGLAATSISTFLGVDRIYSQLLGGGLFVGLVLPPLLFESMTNISMDEFRAISRPVLLLATVGVILSTLIVGLLLWAYASIPVTSAFLFAALIAPTDTATVLEVFRRVRVPARLTTLMEMEAALNDATGIAIFAVILTFVSTSELSLLQASVSFVLVLGGGTLVGVAVAYGARIAQRFIYDGISEVTLTIATVYGSYAIASALGFSGVVAVAIAGLYYGSSMMSQRLPPEATTMVKSFWTVLAFIANTVAFLLIGISTNLVQLLGGLGAIAIAYVAVMAARFLSVHVVLDFPGIVAVRLEQAWKNVAVLGGMRGALSIVLLASIPAGVPSRALIATMTVGVAFLSIVVQGPLLQRYVSRAFAGGRGRVDGKGAPQTQRTGQPVPSAS